MTTTYKKIILLLKCGKIPIVKNEDGDYISCLYQKDGNIFTTGWCNNIDKVYDNRGFIWTKDEVEKDKRRIVRIDTPERHIFKVGDIIDLDMEALEKTSNYNTYKKNFGDGKNLNIKSIYNEKSGLCYDIYTKDKTDSWYIGAEYVIPHIEDTPQKIELSDEQLLEEVRKRGLTIKERLSSRFLFI